MASFDGWVDAGAAATTAAARLAEDDETIATFDGDRLYDDRARRPTLEILDGRPGRTSSASRRSPTRPRRPGGDDLIGEIERFLREQGRGGEGS